MYASAPNWKGQYLPPGAGGMPANHPYPFIFDYRGFRRGRAFLAGLGQGGNAFTCNIWNTPGCSTSDLFHESNQCAFALQQCMNPTAGLTITPPPGAGPAPASALTNPTDVAQIAADQSASNAAAYAAWQAATAAANTCPAGTTVQSDGTCAAPFSMPSWAIPAAVGLLALLVVLR